FLDNRTWTTEFQVELSNGFKLVLWSFYPNITAGASTKSLGRDDWIQLDLIESSPRDSATSLRMYLDEGRLLRDCTYNPMDIGRVSLPKRFLLPVKIPKLSVHEFNPYSVESIRLACQKFRSVNYNEQGLRRRKRSIGDVSALMFKSMRVVKTNHCGPTPESDQDAPLGPEWETDQCCYEHDRCKWVVWSGESKYGITNPQIGPLMHCSCERRRVFDFLRKIRVGIIRFYRVFYQCLANAATSTANMVGFVYFSMYSPRCFYFCDGKKGKRAKTRPAYSWLWGLPKLKKR
ncbi:phospholipase A2, partial [Opisthorchis viverrini]